VALVDGQIHGLANRAAAVMKARRHIGQFDEIVEVFDGCVAPALVEITHKRWSIGRRKHHVVATNHDAT